MTIDGDMLEKILGCDQLPTLPAVALRVIEQTSDANIRIEELARTIEHDQALSAKILKTVNSSFYGLRQRCATIHKAIVMLGLSPVKSLALGFSLVQSVGSDASGGFPFRQYWRRGLHAAVGAKIIAGHVRLDDPDECFIAGLLQDIGMVAMHRALGDSYLRVLELSAGVHGDLLKHELAHFTRGHNEIGAMLGQRWKLPSQLIMPIRYHERPGAAPLDHIELVRCVALANMVTDTIDAERPGDAMRRLYGRASEWFKIGEDDCERLLGEIAVASKEMAGLFRLDCGPFSDPKEILERAEDRIIELQQEEPRESVASERWEALLADPGDNDPITGVLGRIGFDEALVRTFGAAREEDRPISLIQVAVDGLTEATRQGGNIIGDRIAIAITATLNSHFEPHGGIVCRIGSSIFSVILPGVDRALATKTAVEFAERFTSIRRRLVPEALRSAELHISVGLASAEGANDAVFPEPKRLSAASARAARAARDAGGDCVRAFVPRAAA
ncbi:MAG: HDOD domain-containing protein [Planctomycetota bacterium]